MEKLIFKQRVIETTLAVWFDDGAKTLTVQANEQTMAVVKVDKRGAKTFTPATDEELNPKQLRPPGGGRRICRPVS